MEESCGREEASGGAINSPIEKRCPRGGDSKLCL